MRKIKVNGKTRYFKTSVNNVLSIWDKANEIDKRNWYKEAKEFAEKLTLEHNISHKNKLSTKQICAIIAVLSPRMNWNANKKIARDMVLKGDCGYMKLAKAKATIILGLTQKTATVPILCEILKGEKITKFFLNIYNPKVGDVITIDRHAVNVVLNEFNGEGYNLTVSQYAFFENVYIASAKELNVSPLLVQSATWEYFRRVKKNELIKK